MAGLKKNRNKEVIDLEKEYKVLGIEKIKAEEVYAMVPVKLSRTANTKALEIELYAPVRNAAELEKVLKILKSRIKDEKEIAKIIKAAEFSRVFLEEALLDTDGKRVFLTAKDTPEMAAKRFMHDLFGVGEKPKDKLYLDTLSHLAVINWRVLADEVEKKEKTFQLELESDTRIKSGKDKDKEKEKAEEKLKAINSRIPITDKVKAVAEEEKTREVCILRFGSPANTITGNAEVIESKVENLRDKGASPVLLQKEVKRVRDSKPTVVPVVNKPVEPYHARIEEGGRGGR